MSVRLVSRNVMFVRIFAGVPRQGTGVSIVKSVMVVACVSQSHLHYFTKPICVTCHLVMPMSCSLGLLSA